jgi:sugar-specific transcriptional regulator TrmB
MSLKEFTKEIFTRYGFTEEQINVYIVYLRVPRATSSEVYLTLAEEHPELTYELVLEITGWLVEKDFLKKVTGIVDRYIPLEPFFELYIGESKIFRDEIAKIKDSILGDQSNRFEKLEAIQEKSINEVVTAVDDQLKAFFDDSDAKNNSKRDRINSSRNRFTDTSKTLEENIHSIMNTLNSNIKNISDTRVKENESMVDKTKDGLTGLISNLLADFSKRVEELERELKSDLDDHVDRHQTIANDLKPRMEQILEKYLERMDKIVVDLKERIANLLKEHLNHLKNTTDTLQTDLKATVDERHRVLTDQTNEFKSMTLTLIDNLLEHANRFTDFTQDMGKKGFFWMGKKKKYKARHETTIQSILEYTEPMKDDFTTTSEDYIKNTRETTDSLKSDVTDIMTKENDNVVSETTDLDHKAQETINVQLETLAADMSGEIDTTLQNGVKDCSDTTIKLKDSLENSLKTHHRQYDEAINRHKEESLRHYGVYDTDVKRIKEDWIRDLDDKFTEGKRDTSDKITAEINLWGDESADLDRNLSEMLIDHKSKYEENAKTLQNSLSTTTRDTIQNIKDAIADFTLQFMNSIDDGTEIAEKNENKLSDIHIASSSIPEIEDITTWQVVGRDALIAAIKDAIYRVKSSIIIVMPYVLPEILQVISEYAFQKKSVRFMLTSRFDMNTYGDIIRKMMGLGNIQFRQLSGAGEFFALTRDAEEVIIGPATEKEGEMISVVSNQTAFSILYSQFIGPIFMSNSRPIK